MEFAKFLFNFIQLETIQVSGVAKGGGPPRVAHLGTAFFDGVITLFFIVYCNKQLIY